MSVSTSARLAYQHRRPRGVGSRFELWSWYFVRVSGVRMLLLVFGHLLVVHILNSVDIIDYEFVANRWQTIGWRSYDWLLLLLAITHGQNGLRALIDDDIHSRVWQALAHTLNWVSLDGRSGRGGSRCAAPCSNEESRDD